MVMMANALACIVAITLESRRRQQCSRHSSPCLRGGASFVAAVPQVSETISFAEGLRQLMGVMKGGIPRLWGGWGFLPDRKLGAQEPKSPAESRPPLPRVL